MNERDERGRVGRRMTLEQRRVLLQRIRREVEGVVEDIQATAASLGAAGGTGNVGATERATLHLIWEEQQRQRLELERLYGEYDSLAFRRRVGTPRAEGTAAA